MVLLLNRSHQAVFCQSEPGNVTKLSDDAVVFDEQDAVAVFDHLRQFGGDEDHAAARVREAGDRSGDVALGMDVHAVGRVIEQQDLRMALKRLADNDFLLVATGELADGDIAARRFDLHGFNDLLHDLRALPVIDEKALFAQRGEQREQGIVIDAVHQGQALCVAVLRDKKNAAADGVARLADAELFPVQPDLTAARRVDAEQHIEDLRAPGALQTGQTDDLARADGEAQGMCDNL